MLSARYQTPGGVMLEQRRHIPECLHSSLNALDGARLMPNAADRGDLAGGEAATRHFHHGRSLNVFLSGISRDICLPVRQTASPFSMLDKAHRRPIVVKCHTSSGLGLSCARSPSILDSCPTAASCPRRRTRLALGSLKEQQSKRPQLWLPRLQAKVRYRSRLWAAHRIEPAAPTPPLAPPRGGSSAPQEALADRSSVCLL
jgi:hypothetical protein